MRSDFVAAFLGAAIVCVAPAVAASPTTFTYQGHLAQDGEPAEGAYEFEIRLLDNLGNQIGMIQTASEIVTAGAFTMEIDFGNAAFDGNERYLEISVRSVADGGAYTTLSPNQLVTSTPIAQFALTGNEGPVGPQGSQGDQGDPGNDGSPGDDGNDGAQGTQGDPGDDGSDGATGSDGPEGPVGPQGNPGDSHWLRNGTTTYFNEGNVGVGSSSSSSKFTVVTAGSTATSTQSTRSTGTSYGLFSVAASDGGRAVYGEATSLTGVTYGAKFVSASTSGLALYGTATATSGINYGIKGRTHSDDGYAGYFQGGRNYFEGNVGFGKAEPVWPIDVDTAQSRAVFGKSSAPLGDGLYGLASHATGSGNGVYGHTSGTGGNGVQGFAFSSTGVTNGVKGVSQSSGGSGVFGLAVSFDGVNHGVRAKTNSDDGYAGYFEGGRNYFEGRVGVGTAIPTDQFHVNASSGVDAMRIMTNGSTRIRVNASGGVSLGGNSSTIGAGDVYIVNNLGIGDNTPDEKLDVVGNAVISGRLTVGTPTPAPFGLAVNGSAGKPGGGSWSVFSDQRLKKNIASMTGSLDTISALRPVNFEYKSEDHFSYIAGVQRGFIAQEVQKVIPQWVNTADDGFFYLDQVGYEALIVDAIQELRAEKDAEIQQLRDRLDRLERMMALSVER